MFLVGSLTSRAILVEADEMSNLSNQSEIDDQFQDFKKKQNQTWTRSEIMNITKVEDCAYVEKFPARSCDGLNLLGELADVNCINCARHLSVHLIHSPLLK